MRVGDKRILFVVLFLDKQSWKEEKFTTSVEAVNFYYSLKRSPDLIKSAKIIEVLYTVNAVNEVSSFEV